MVLLIASSGSLFAQQPQLKVTILSAQEIRLSWPSDFSNYLLESAPGLKGATVWTRVSATPKVEGSEWVVRVTAGNAIQFYRLRQALVQLTTLSETSPAAGEGNMAVTRETILRLSAPLAPTATVGNDRLYAEFGGQKLLSRVQLSTDRRTLTLFYLAPLPGRARIRVTFNGDGLNDAAGQAVDADGNGQAGGKLSLDFDTLANGGVAGTVVTGRVFASELAQAVAAQGQLVNRPLAGVRVTVDGREQDLFAVTDATGNFRLDPAPAGPFFVHIDGRTVTVPGGGYPKGPYYPYVGKEWVSRIGEEVNIGNVFLPLIQEQTLQPVSATEDTIVTFPAAVLQQHPELKGVQLLVPANSLFADDGKRGGFVGIAPVAPDRLPSPLPPGLSFPLVITVQTDGASNFDRPVPVCFPNLPDPVTGILKAPGAKSALWSFNHDLGDWEVVGPMTVSADGKLVCSDPGVGLLQPGWHGDGGGSTASGGTTRGSGSAPPTQPLTTGTQECVRNECPCDGGCASSNSVIYQSGEEVLSRTDLMIPGRAGMDFVMDRTYRSRLDYNGPLGFGWTFRYNEALFIEPNGDIVRYNGRSHEGMWKLQADGSYTAPEGYFSALIKGADGLFFLLDAEGFQRIYRDDGRLIVQQDRFGNRMSFDYDARGNLHRVIDVYGREIQFVFSAFPDGVHRLTQVEDFTGRIVVYEYDAKGDLVSVTSPAVTGTSTGNDFPAGRKERYAYSSGFAASDLNHNLLAVIAPEEVAKGGPPRLQWTYGTDPGNPVTFDRVLAENEGGINASGVAAGGVLRVEYQTLNESEPFGQPELPRARTRVTERNGNVKDYFINERQHHILVREYTRGLRPEEPPYYETRVYHDEKGQVIRRVLPEGNEMRYGYDSSASRRSQGNLLEVRRVADPRRGGGNDLITTYTYEPLFNQVLTITDPRGNDPSYVPPIGTQSAARYTKRFFYDYQESTAVVPMAALFGIDLSKVPRGLGDLNGDGRTDQVAGQLVRLEDPPVLLTAGSMEATRRKTTSQPLISQTQWNDRGQTTARIDPEGNVTDFLYYPENDPDGNGMETFAPYVALGSTPLGYLKAVITDSRVSPRRSADQPAPLAVRITYVYDTVGNIIGVMDPRGVLTQMEVNQLNEIVATTRGADVSVAVAARQLVTGEAAFHYRTRRHYDFNGRVIAVDIEDRDGSTSGVGEFVEPNFTYDILDNVLTRKQELDATRSLITEYRYDPNELLTSTVQPEGNGMKKVYDGRNLPFRVTRGFGSAEASTMQIDYDANGNRLRMIDADDDDGDGKLGTTLHAYDGFDRQIQVTDVLGQQRVTGYDPASNPVRTRFFGHPAGRPGSPNVLLSDSFSHPDEANRVFRTDDALFVADGFAPMRPPQLIDGNADGFVTMIKEYDALSRPTFAFDDSHQLKQTRYDGASRVVEVGDAVGNKTFFQYDQNSNPVRISSTEVSPDGLVPPETFTTTYVHDQLNRLVRVSDNAGQTTHLDYDSRDNVISRSDPEGAPVPDPMGLLPAGLNVNAPGNTATYFYDGFNRLIRTVMDVRQGGSGGGALDRSNPFNADGQVTVAYEFDGNSRLGAMIDDNGKRTSYVYDALDRRIKQIHADGTMYSFVFSRDDSLTQITDPNGTVVRRSVDELGRVRRSEVTAFGRGVVGTKIETYEYDGLSRLTRATDDNGDSVRTQDFERVYDSLSRVIEERQNGRVMSTVFSGDGERLADTYPGGRRIENVFDAIDRIQTQSDGRGRIAEFRWFGQGYRELARLNGNGTMDSFLNNTGNEDVGYDTVRRPVRQRLIGRVANVLLDREYAYNRANRRTSEKRHDDTGLTDQYAYDSLYRVVRTDLDQSGRPGALPRSLSKIEYALDGTGNRRRWTTTTADIGIRATPVTVNDVNEYTTIGPSLRTHSSNGNLTDDGQRLYAYDYRNRLVSASWKSDAAPIAHYLYDAANRRRQKTVFSPAVGNRIEAQTLYFYDRWQVCEEQNAARATETTFVHSPRYIDCLVQFERTASHPLGAGSFYVHQNARYDVIAISDAGGNLVAKQFYDDFGFGFDEAKQPVVGSDVSNAFGFQGQRFDPETGLYYFRARYYDPSTGRFLQRDPVWDSANHGNQYAFAGHSPVSGFDPLGQKTWEEMSPRERGAVMSALNQAHKSILIAYDQGIRALRAAARANPCEAEEYNKQIAAMNAAVKGMRESVKRQDVRQQFFDDMKDRAMRQLEFIQDRVNASTARKIQQIATKLTSGEPLSRAERQTIVSAMAERMKSELPGPAPTTAFTGMLDAQVNALNAEANAVEAIGKRISGQIDDRTMLAQCRIVQDYVNPQKLFLDPMFAEGADRLGAIKDFLLELDPDVENTVETLEDPTNAYKFWSGEEVED